MSLRRLLAIGFLVLALVVPGAAQAGSLTAVEYFHAGFGHYFLTADPDEVAALDAGTPGGWARTGVAFSVFSAADDGGLPVCRLFSAAFAPRSSHFYTPFATECAALRTGTTWAYESIAFYVTLPSAEGTCAAGATTIYRLYNNGASGAPNHRYTSQRVIADAMLAQGWVAEGHGVTGAFACGPPAPTNQSAVVAVTSSTNGQLYSATISVPAGHGPDSDPIPVVYALDGQFRYVPLLDAIQQTGARAILVTIDDMGRRQTDYNMPGAVDYLAFLTRDLIPYVEARYRADPRKRVLSGLSTGGNFPFHALYLESPGPWSFAHYWSSEGAFWQQADVVAREEQEMYERVGSAPFPVTLVLARGGVGPSTNSALVHALYDKIAKRNYNGLRLFDFYYPGFGHVPMDAPSFRDELGLLPK